MKKAISLIVCLMMILSLAACGSDAVAEEQMITRAAEETVATEAAPAAPAEEAPAETQAAPAAARTYSFLADGVELIPGTAFDASVLPEAESVYEVPSCAIVGTDNLYNYGTFELTAFNDGTGEQIYSILLLDPNVTTPEGLALGDSIAKMTELYGEDFTQDGTAYTYSGSGQLLYIIAQGETVASIEYRAITE